MPTSVVSIVKYEEPGTSVRKAVELCGGLDRLSPGSRVFIKPNIVFWSVGIPFPKWGVLTTSRIVEDMVELLKENGIGDITIGEGMVARSHDKISAADAFQRLGYEKLRARYGVRYLSIMERPFEKVDLGDGITLNFNKDILHSDFVIDLPVMKTHVQTIVSLGIKNLKGTIDMPSRKRCHNADPVKNLHFYVARLADKMPPMFTLIDGIYTNERGPGIDGRIHRKNILVGSGDVLSADLVGTKILGFTPEEIPHLKIAAQRRNRPLDLSDIDIVGESIDRVASRHEWDWNYSQAEDGSWLPTPLVNEGMKGVSFPKYDSTMCTYCSRITGIVLTAIRTAWKEQDPDWKGIEVLTGKAMAPTEGMRKTILLGKCMYKAHKDSPVIEEMIPVKGCPPDPMHIVKALHRAGIMVDDTPFRQIENLPQMYMRFYKGRPEFDESHFRIE